jgi:hypothetical protein
MAAVGTGRRPSGVSICRQVNVCSVATSLYMNCSVTAFSCVKFPNSNFFDHYKVATQIRLSTFPSSRGLTCVLRTCFAFNRFESLPGTYRREKLSVLQSKCHDIIAEYFTTSFCHILSNSLFTNHRISQ